MKKRDRLAVLGFYLAFCFIAKTGITQELPGFVKSAYFDEQITTFTYGSDIRIHINAPAAENFDAAKPVGMALFALPNGNTIEQTVGKILKTGDDWHYDIQHIGAQTRFLRQQITDYNLITVYLEASQKSWPAWKAAHTDHAQILKKLTEYLKSCFSKYDPFVILTGHSGGGRFTFSFMDAFDEIPAYVNRIAFLDSDYGYEHSYGDKMIQWLNSSEDNYLCVLAYNDSIALYNGEPIVSATGGTWYRSRIMQKYMADQYSFTTDEDDDFIRHSALDGRVKILLKKNPERLILHTVQVEKNGFIHAMLTGTSLENQNYTYYTDRIYSDLIQENENTERLLNIPLRSDDAIGGYEFMESIKNLSFADREIAIFEQISTGNLPSFMRKLISINSSFADANGVVRTIQYRVMPDYLAVGSDSNYCRIPMGPITAQKLADQFGMIMPTRKLVDDIYTKATIKLSPVTYAPVGNQNESVEKFIEHNTAIEQQRLAASAELGELVGGIKKDVVVSNKIVDPSRPDHVVIYGWHQLSGVPIQPLTNIHIDSYVDYSHGIRLIDQQVFIDGQPYNIHNVLKDDILYKILSDESGAMTQTSYIAGLTAVSAPKAFGIKMENASSLKIILKDDASVEYYQLYLSSDGLNFEDPITFNGSSYLIEDVAQDSIVYFKLKAGNSLGLSPYSEVLGGIVSNGNPEVLIVNGFDRSSTGNTYDFIRQHASAVKKNGKAFNAATNDALTAGLFSLNDYDIADFILGDESTIDETFSTSEQTLVSSFLKQGGKIFVSGAEIAWDLDYKGSTADKSFFRNYLKAQYLADAPGNVVGTHYSAQGTASGLFEGINSITFDNGTHGTFDVDYADALNPVNGSITVVNYKNVNNFDIGGVSFSGTFLNGSSPGKLVYLGFPFETIYPEATRDSMMGRIFNFMDAPFTSIESQKEEIPETFELKQNYPNPFNPVTTISYTLPFKTDVKITIHDSRGALVFKRQFFQQSSGKYYLTWNGENAKGEMVSSGNYFYTLQAEDFKQTRKMILIR
ncbi:MAG: T9SS type A sorting domain-containing protein [Calditrichae bacterium]|nr:T9SS type A sorting domain-containing protein [Calditrichia bacterium]